VALDSVNNRMFVPEPGNIRILVYQLDGKGHHVRHTADNVVGHQSLLGRRRNSVTNRTDAAGGAENGVAVDSINQRLFVRDRSRILVYDIKPENFSDYPEATHVIGQPDFTTNVPGDGRKKFHGSKLIVDEKNQRLFVEDGERILVFDINPNWFESYPEATHVIGQPNFDTRVKGLGPNRISRSHGMAYDEVDQRLFISDSNNNRILIFNVDPEHLTNDPDAIAVLGQPDFYTNDNRFIGAAALPEERMGFRNISTGRMGGIDYDSVHKRLFISQLRDNRVLVFNAAPGQLDNDPQAIAVLGQPDFETFDPVISRSRFAFPKDPSVDDENQILYVSEGFPGGNRVIAYDIRPEVLKNGADAVDVIGHVDDFGRNDFNKRVANDRLDARITTSARALALDPVDHRLWVADEYNNRVLGFQLDRDNRLQQNEAQWVFGQKDFYSAVADRSQNGMKIPLAVAYDVGDKRLYVGDGWNDRVLVYDADPDRIKPGGNQPAIAVLGQPDFKTQDPGASRNRFNFKVDVGQGIASNMLPIGIAIDAKRRRAYIADGGNHRILVFDVHKDRLQNGANAIAIIGQDNYTSDDARLEANGFNWPGHLDFDAENDRLFAIDNRHHRVLAFDVAGTRLQNGMSATHVIGQPDFTTTTSPEHLRGPGKVINSQSLAFPNGVAYDPVKDQLYIADQGNNRVSVFDVNPDQLQNHPEAIAVLGQSDDKTKSDQILADVSAQDQIYDPRGLAFDSENQQLFVGDSHWGRILVFRPPSTTRDIEIPGLGSTQLSSLDPIVALRPYEQKSGYAALESASGVGAVSFTIENIPVLDKLTEQQSRVLVSQTGNRIVSPNKRSVAFVDNRNNAEAIISVINPGKKRATVQLTLRNQNGKSEKTSFKLEGGSKHSITVSDLFSTTFDTGALLIESNTAVTVNGDMRVANQNGEQVRISLPVVTNENSDDKAILANITTGGGFHTEIIFLNVADEKASGVMSLMGSNGRQIKTDNYAIEPGGFLVWQAPTMTSMQQNSYLTIDPASIAVPAITAAVQLVDQKMLTMTTTESASALMQGQIPVNTIPDIIRHNRSTEIELMFANPGAYGASIRLIMRDPDGNEIARTERLLLPGTQEGYSLGQLFNQTKLIGTVAFLSDIAIGVSARQVTTNIRGEDILTELPVMTPNESTDLLVFPYIDGGGTATQVFVAAGHEEKISTDLKFYDNGGKPLEVILR
jgi:DNA-binding beta-propeller fold protein YncE